MDAARTAAMAAGDTASGCCICGGACCGCDAAGGGGGRGLEGTVAPSESLLIMLEASVVD
jgi:hypothetical protein